MKHFILFVSVAFFIVFQSYAQDWTQALPQNKLQAGELSFYEIRDAFNDFWEPYHVDQGYYYMDGERIRAPYYKQFKRWEWFWEDRIDPKTGAFPDRETLDRAYAGIMENRSVSGNWSPMGPDSSPGGYAGLGRLNCVAFVPGSTSEYYAGAASGGIWYTADDGASWSVLNDTVPVLGVSDILVIDPVTGPDILYIATGDRDRGSLWSLGGQQSNDNNSVGVLKSTDGGATWAPTGLSFTVGQKVRVNRLLMDPNSAYQTIYAATTSGLYKTTDGGTTWPLLSSEVFIDMEFKPGDPTVIYGSTQGSTSSIYRSTDSGASWTSVTTYSGRRTELAVSPAQPAWVYAITANSSGALLGVHKSTTSGTSFTTVYSSSNLLGWACDGSGSSGQGSYDLCIAVEPADASKVYVGGVNTWKSSDGGQSFNIVNHWTGCGSPSNAQNVHADKHFLAFQNSTTLFECNDGGLYKSSDGGINWTHLSSGMAISQIYRLGVGQTSAGEIITGLQDNGTKARLGGTWTDVIGGDGFECIVDYTNENIQYGALYYGSIYKTTNYWTSKNNITNSLPGSGAWCTPYLMDPTNNQVLYVGYEDVWKTTDQGGSWSQISNQGSTTDFRNMAIAASNTSYIYAATYNNLYRTINGGGATQQWTNINGNLPVGSANITYISVKTDNPDHVWVSMGGYNADGVYESTDGGTSWNNISAGLPQLPVMCVIENKQYASGIELYAATDAGVYVNRDGGNWQLFSSGLPNVVVTELEIYYDQNNPDDSKIYAATFGRGVWQSDLFSTYMQPVADFSGNPLSGVFPLGVAFTDLSQNTVTSWQWDFGDGNASTVQNPSHTYADPGTYSVKLLVTGPGGIDSITKTDYILVNYPPPLADFTADITSGIAPLNVSFTDLSTDSVNTWHWDFGDGDTSNIQHPQHTFSPGTYTVSLNVSGPGGNSNHTKTDYIIVNYAPPTAGFTGDPVSGLPPLGVTFTDMSADSVNSWSWAFGDGTTSLVQNPVHLYENAGEYTVSLTVNGPGGSDTEIKTNYITVSDLPPTANFAGDPTSGPFPLLVNFTNLSQGAISAYTWYFGDGENSSLEDPEHTYQLSGSYTVSLKTEGPGGTDSIAKVDYITVIVGIEEYDDGKVAVYPNPCSQFLMINSGSAIRSVGIADIIGNIVFENTMECPGPCKQRIDMRDMHPGIYFCRIIKDNGKLVLMKILKE